MKTVLSLLLWVLALLTQAQQLIDSHQREIVIRHVNVVPMDKEQILADQTVVIKNGTITALGPKAKYSKDALVVDAKGKYLIPGLAEMHAHVPPIDDLEPMKEVLFLFAANGITTIRGMLGHPKHLVLRDMVNSGEVLGPHFYTTGPSFNGLSVKTPEAAEAMVRSQKKEGYDFLKLHPGLNRETFPAIVSTAKEVGIPFVGHVSYGVGIWRAIDADYSTIDHLDGFVEGLVPGIDTIPETHAGLFALYLANRADTTQIPRLTKGLKDHHIWVVPTQSLAERWFAPGFTVEKFKGDPENKYLKQETINSWIEAKNNLLNNPRYSAAGVDQLISLRRRIIRDCQHAGVGLLLGSDAPQVFNVPGFSVHNELRYIVASGLSPYEALKTGTVNVATYLNLPNAGVIKPGAIADLVLIGGNPLKDISQTRNVEGVMLNGRWLSKEYIDAGLKKLVK